jgi:hypothetical protein
MEINNTEIISGKVEGTKVSIWMSETYVLQRLGKMHLSVKLTPAICRLSYLSLLPLAVASTAHSFVQR